MSSVHRTAPAEGSSLLSWGGTVGGLAAVCFSEVAAACELPDLADATYRWLEPAAGQLMYNGAIWTVFGSADHFLGRCASALGRVDDAGTPLHGRPGHRTASRCPAPSGTNPFATGRARRSPGRFNTNASSRRLPRPLRHSTTSPTFARAPKRSPDLVRQQREAPTPVDRGPNRLTREGDVWTISFDTRTVRLKDTKGIRLLARLLTDPGREIHALDLVGAPGLVGGDDGGPVLDAAAKDAYRRRLNDLAEDLEEARCNNDPERAARAEAEIDALTEQLAAAVGVGGRDRRGRLSVRTGARRSDAQPTSRHPAMPPTFTRRSLATSR